MQKYISLLLLLVLTSATTWAQRIIIPNPPNRAGIFELELRDVKIESKIENGVAVTTLEQVFFNPTRNQLQGSYLFPIPDMVSYKDFTMLINGVETKGELLDADKAQKIYEDIVRKSLDPALLEYYQQGVLKVRIFPIQPQSEQTIRLTFRHVLPLDNGQFEFALPLGAGKAENQLENFVVDIELGTKGPLKTLFSPTHEIDIVRKGANEARISMEAESVSLLKQFKLYFGQADKSVGAALQAFKEKEKGDGYFMLQFSPGIEAKQKAIEKDITFVLDASGSMTGEKMEQAQEALKFCVQHLNEGDRFNIVRFSTEATTLFSDLKSADKSNQKEALDYIDHLEAMGGTNIEEALGKALNVQHQSDRPYFIIFLTDGKPTIGETGTDALLKKVKDQNTDHIRIFTFGIGTELNTQLLDKITEQAQGYRTYVLPDEDIEVKVSDFYLKVAYPVLTDLELKVNGNKVQISELYPKNLADLFRGESLTILGKYRGGGQSTFTLTGKQNGKLKAFEYELDFPEKSIEHDYVPPLWGARAVGYLLDQVRLNGQNQELVDEVVRLSKQFGIITPYTSYLILEDEAIQIGSRRLEPEDAVISQRVTPSSRGAFEEQESRYNTGMKKASGKESVIASEEIQDLNHSSNIEMAQSSRERMYYEDDAGVTRNLADGILNVQGRAQYLTNGQWLDAALWSPENQALPERQIKFNSKDYFELLKNEPESAEFLSLGPNVRFVLNGVIWEVIES